LNNQFEVKTHVAPTPESLSVKKSKIIQNSLVASLTNINKVKQYTDVTDTYSNKIIELTQPNQSKKVDVLNFFSSKYNNVLSNVHVWSSGWESHHADFIAQEIAHALVRRVPFRSIKLQITQELEENTNKAWGSVRGIRVTCSGRGNRKSKKAQRPLTFSLT